MTHLLERYWLYAPLLITLLGLLDYVTGYELSFAPFYFVPIALVTWAAGRRAGLLACAVCSLVWLIADVASGHVHSHPTYYAWNTLIRGGSFVCIALLLARLRAALRYERRQARVDPLTGLANARLFDEAARLAMDAHRRSREPLTVAFIDLDDFKQVNDRLGHGAGDRLLRMVAAGVRRALRRTDLVARVGGDEFAVLLPRTGQHDARQVLTAMHGALRAEMRRHQWPVGLSIGAVTCDTAPESVEELIGVADELMYTAKRAGKNRLALTVYPPPGPQGVTS